MQTCKGMPRDPDQGFAKPCPIRFKCVRYERYPSASRTDKAEALEGPYDLEDEECGKFLAKG
jgi:hypothetical protein